MSYANYEDLLNRHRKFAEDLKDASFVNSEIIYPAEKEIEGKLGEKFTIPFTGNPPVIKAMVLDTAIMRWLIPRNPERADALKASIDDQIDRMVEGKEAIVLEDNTVVLASESGEVYHNLDAYHQTFSMQDPENQCVDEDRLYDEEQDRQ